MVIIYSRYQRLVYELGVNTGDWESCSDEELDDAEEEDEEEDISEGSEESEEIEEDEEEDEDASSDGSWIDIPHSSEDENEVISSSCVFYICFKKFDLFILKL